VSAWNYSPTRPDGRAISRRISALLGSRPGSGAPTREVAGWLERKSEVFEQFVAAHADAGDPVRAGETRAAAEGARQAAGRWAAQTQTQAEADAELAAASAAVDAGREPPRSAITPARNCAGGCWRAASARRSRRGWSHRGVRCWGCRAWRRRPGTPRTARTSRRGRDRPGDRTTSGISTTRGVGSTRP
jgi:hypothetical protein